ncbi:MAG: CaiB/BaiF CoA-transferase family protein [Dehalococcoidia bacterium]|nr:CaiB/BaiF CoA-transferase family protein [Dehalococcoidia bacterium]
MTLALEGTRILDLTWQGPGPYCTMLLGDLGADVVRIQEPLVSGGSSRRVGEKPTARPTDERGLAYDAHGRNKRSITLNLKNEAARKIFYDLVKTADVVLDGFRPGVSIRLGVDYATLKEINPAIICCSISGFGQTGPYNKLAGHDINYLSIAGALSMIGRKGGPPAIPQNYLADFGGGAMHAVMGILAALLARQRTGVGQYVDVSLTDCVMSLMTWDFARYLMSGETPTRGETTLSGGAPYYDVYETKDGKYISIGSIEPWLFSELCKALGREDLVQVQANPEKQEEIFAFFRETFKTRTRDDWFAYLRQFDNCIAPVLAIDEVVQDPQVQARQMITEIDHPTLGKVKQVGISIKMSDTPGSIRCFTPARGEHTDAILSNLGYAAGDIQALREQGAI